MSKTKKNTKLANTNPVAKKVPVKAFDLGAVRTNFDGLRNVAAKLPEGTQKTSIMTKIEEIYLSTATWIQQLSGGATQGV